MFGKIVYISDNIAHISIPSGTPVHENLMNLNVVFEDNEKKILGEVVDVSESIIKVHFLGEITSGRFTPGVIRKPTMEANIRIIKDDELELITGSKSSNTFRLGYSPVYNNKEIYIDINELCSNHLAIFGNTGSGKSYGVASLIQSLFYNQEFRPYRANYMIFDAYGEYHTAFSKMNEVNPNYQFKIYTTNRNQTEGELISIPLWLLNIDDYALLLEADTHSQLTIIERMLKLVRIFATDDNIKSSVIKNFVGTDKISEARTILESTVADYEQKMSEYFSESENDPSFFEYTRRGEATPVIRDNVGTLRETPIEGKKKDKKKNDQNNHPSHNDEDEDEEDDTDEDEDGNNEDDEEDLDDDLKDDLHESDNKKSSKPNPLKKPVSQPSSNQQQSSAQNNTNASAVKPQESLTKKIQNKAMDTEMNMNKAKGKADEAFTSIKNAAKAVASIPAGIVNGIQTKIKEWNEWDENKKKERILDSGYRSSVYKLMKTAIMYRATWQINKIWVVWLYIIRHTPIYQDRNKRIKNELLVELDTEIQVTEEKIQDASSNGDQQQKYQLMRLKKKLEAEKIRVVTNSKRI